MPAPEERAQRSDGLSLRRFQKKQNQPGENAKLRSSAPNPLAYKKLNCFAVSAFR